MTIGQNTVGFADDKAERNLTVFVVEMLPHALVVGGIFDKFWMKVELYDFSNGLFFALLCRALHPSVAGRISQ